jgi:Rhs element Vgr protein
MPAVTATILSNGRVLDPACEVLSIDIRREVDRIPQAEVRLIDGSAAQQRFALSDTKFWEPGAEIEIKLRYEGQRDERVFKGVVVRHGVEASSSGSTLVIGCKDAAVRLTAARQSSVFRSMTDGAIIQKILQDAGLEIGRIADTRPEHPEMVQYHCSPWDFMLSRADAQGLLVLAEDGKISARKIAIQGEPRHRFSYGISEIFDLEIEADAGQQPESVESLGWDAKKQQPTEASRAKKVQLTPGNLDGERLGKALGNGTRRLCHPVPLAADELQAWADAGMARSRMALLRGRLAIPGSAEIGLLDVISIQGVGERFNGKTLVTGLRHRLDAAGWQTDVQFGLPAEGFAQRPHILDAPAAGLLPAVSGLQLGVVADFEEDPDKELRVKVVLPGIDSKKSAAVWARLAAPEAGKGRGYFFRPEPKDEVVVAFLNGDPRCPVILGALYGSKNEPPSAMGALDDKNEKRGIVTRKGSVIGFVDGDEASVFIQTPKGGKLLLDDGEESISLSDKHGNSITMSKDGIVVKSAKELNLEADQAVQIKGSEVNVK